MISGGYSGGQLSPNCARLSSKAFMMNRGIVYGIGGDLPQTRLGITQCTAAAGDACRTQSQEAQLQSRGGKGVASRCTVVFAPSHNNREAWELRLLAQTQYALFEAFEADETEKQREEARLEMEARLRDYVLKSIKHVLPFIGVPNFTGITTFLSTPHPRITTRFTVL